MEGVANNGKRGNVMFLTLNYHIINRTIHDTIAISEEAFAAQLRYLHTHDYTTLSLDQAIAIVDGKQEAPPRSVLLTVEDGGWNARTYRFAINRLTVSPGWSSEEFATLLESLRANCDANL